MQAVSNRLQKANRWFWSFQQWHLCWPSCYCLSNSNRLWREVV